MVKMVNKTSRKREPVSDFPRQHRGNKYGVYRLFSSIGLVIILGLLTMIGAQYIQHYRSAQELARFEEKIAEQELRQEELLSEIDRLQHNDYIEVLARDRLGLVKPGEIIFQLED